MCGSFEGDGMLAFPKSLKNILKKVPLHTLFFVFAADTLGMSSVHPKPNVIGRAGCRVAPGWARGSAPRLPLVSPTPRRFSVTYDLTH